MKAWWSSIAMAGSRASSSTARRTSTLWIPRCSMPEVRLGIPSVVEAERDNLLAGDPAALRTQKEATDVATAAAQRVGGGPPRAFAHAYTIPRAKAAKEH